ncbi:hypothetical protein ACLVWU_13345 [Bdellovibrio sp. HCB290]
MPATATVAVDEAYQLSLNGIIPALLIKQHRLGCLKTNQLEGIANI